MTGAGGVELGAVSRILYHPSEPRAVGLMVRPTAMLVVVERTETFLPLAAVTFGDDAIRTEFKKLPTGHKAATALGYDPDTVVIWTGMNVTGPSGSPVGFVSDVDFAADTGEVRRMEVAAGAVADAAHGRYLVPADAIEGYRTGAVRVTRDQAGFETTGGMAKAAAKGVTAAAVAAAAAGAAAEDAVLAASHATGRAVKAVSDGKVADTVTKRVRTTWQDTINAFREGRDGDD